MGDIKEKLTKTCRVCDKKTFSVSVQYDDERLFTADLVDAVSTVDETVKGTTLIQCTGCEMRVSPSSVCFGVQITRYPPGEGKCN